MAQRHIGSRVRVCVLEYRLKYPDAAKRLATIRADFLKACAAFKAGDLDAVAQTTAGDQSSSWAIGATSEEIIDAFAQSVEYFERGGVPSGWARATI